MNSARRTRILGFTLIEAIVVMAIISILAGIGFWNLRPPSARLMANDYKAMLQQARFEAIKRNLPVAVVWNGQQFSTLVKNDGSINCETASTTSLSTKRVSDYRDLQVSHVSGTGSGIVWLPSGMARTCTNNAVVTGKATFKTGTAEISVFISQSGRVRVGT